MLTLFFFAFQMNIGGSEWIIIALLALFLLFGTKKVPQVSRTVGKAHRGISEGPGIIAEGN